MQQNYRNNLRFEANSECRKQWIETIKRKMDREHRWEHMWAVSWHSAWLAGPSPPCLLPPYSGQYWSWQGGDQTKPGELGQGGHWSQPGNWGLIKSTIKPFSSSAEFYIDTIYDKPFSSSASQIENKLNQIYCQGFSGLFSKRNLFFENYC